MIQAVEDVEVAQESKTTITCPRCSQHVDGFQMDGCAMDNIIVILKHCGCASHSSEGNFRVFVDALLGGFERRA